MKVFGLKVDFSPRRASNKVSIRLKDNLGLLGYKAIGLASQWVTIPGLIEKTAYEVKMTDDGWMITLKGSSLPLRVFSKKQDAVREARKMAKSHKAGLAIFTRSGTLQTHQSFAL